MAHKPRILYIDDEADLLELAASFFEEENLPIETCTNMQEAIEMIKQNSYDLIISDAKMPTGSGYELMKMIKEEGYFKGKSILVTGNVQTIHETENHGYDQLLWKPLRFEELVDTVKKLLSL